MLILVSDTSVLIDLERGGLLELAFQGPWTLVVPDLLYEQELASENGPYLRSLGLGVVSLTGEEVEDAQALSEKRQALSLSDCFALCLAHRADHLLLSGDGAMRDEAEARRVRCHGLLWLLDELRAHQPESGRALLEGLRAIHDHPRCRLPKLEVTRRLRAWQ